MEISFSGKSVVVAGGSRGLGLAMATSFARSGASVAICARGKPGIDSALGELASYGARVLGTVCDLADATATVRFIDEAATVMDGIDVLVNNASAMNGGDDEAAWLSAVAIDLMATVNATWAAVPYLERAGAGAIVNTASIRGLTGSARLPAYAAAKAAVINLTLSQSAALAAKRIRVNAIAPGSIEFPGGIWDRRKREDPRLYQATVKAFLLTVSGLLRRWRTWFSFWRAMLQAG
jgi:3-oxoacyl-[acyl-carrier protein] reductase